MPLHIWEELTGWDGIHHFWITHLFNWIKSLLPPALCSYVWSFPSLAVTGAYDPPAVAVRHSLSHGPAPAHHAATADGPGGHPGQLGRDVHARRGRCLSRLT